MRNYLIYFLLFLVLSSCVKVDSYDIVLGCRRRFEGEYFAWSAKVFYDTKHNSISISGLYDKFVIRYEPVDQTISEIVLSVIQDTINSTTTVYLNQINNPFLKIENLKEIYFDDGDDYFEIAYLFYPKEERQSEKPTLNKDSIRNASNIDFSKENRFIEVFMGTLDFYVPENVIKDVDSVKKDIHPILREMLKL